MCARYTLYSQMKSIKDLFNVKNILVKYKESYNVVPSTEVPVIVDDGEKCLVGKKWGYFPKWMKRPILNARGETVHEKSTFAAAFTMRRCIFLLDGYYEWKLENGKKMPTYFQIKSKEPFGVAGITLIDKKDGVETENVVLITFAPNGLASKVHDRMPAILTPQDHEAWLDNSYQDHGYIKSLLKTYPEEEMIATPVSPFVNSPRNNGPECIKPMSDNN